MFSENVDKVICFYALLIYAPQICYSVNDEGYKLKLHVRKHDACSMLERV